MAKRSSSGTGKGPGCNGCWKGWKGQNDQGQLVACTLCRPHVIDYLTDHGRGEPTRLMHEDRRSDGPYITKPDWFDDLVEEATQQARARRNHVTVEVLTVVPVVDVLEPEPSDLFALPPATDGDRREDTP